MTACPCCKRELPFIEIPIVSLDYNAIILRGKAIKVSPMQAEIMQVLVNQIYQVVKYEDLITKIYGVAEPETSDRVMYVQVCHLRKHLAETEWFIESVNRAGYRLVKKEHTDD